MDAGTIAIETIKTLGIVAAAVTTMLNHQRLKRVSTRTKQIQASVNGAEAVKPARTKPRKVEVDAILDHKTIGSD